VTRERPFWPCHEGCDHCCRHLSEPLRLTRAEWARVEIALAELPKEARAEIERRVFEIVEGEASGRICPFLEREAGVCQIYGDRPIDCRMYGFYQDRDGGYYCFKIEDVVEEEGEDGIVWGHRASVERRLENVHGPRVSLADWAAERRRFSSRG